MVDTKTKNSNNLMMSEKAERKRDKAVKRFQVQSKTRTEIYDFIRQKKQDILSKRAPEESNHDLSYAGSTQASVHDIKAIQHQKKEKATRKMYKEFI